MIEGGGVGGPTAERPISRSFSDVFADGVAGRNFKGFGIGFGPVWHNCLARFDTFSRLELRCEFCIDFSIMLDPPHVAKSQEYVILSAKIMKSKVTKCRISFIRFRYYFGIVLA